MGFSTRRGRPCLKRPSQDTGTRELAARHAAGLTLEALDLCLKRELISEEEHRAGLHLRWLYSLRFGAPTIRAYDHSYLGGTLTRKEDDTWRARREKEYEQAVALLKQAGAYIMVSNIAIFNRFPRFLLPPRTVGALSRKTAESQAINERELALLQEGLQLLHGLFAQLRYAGYDSATSTSFMSSKGRTNPSTP